MAFFFFNDTATTEIYTLSLHDALPIWLALCVKIKALNRYFIVSMPSNSTASAPQQGRDKLHLQLARLFRSKVSTGAWPVGSAIPTVQELEALHRSEEHTSELQSPCNLV